MTSSTQQSTLSPAHRLAAIKDSITVKITAIAAAMKKEGQDVVGFGAGEPDFDTPENIKKAAIAAINSGKNRYTAATGIIELKEAICRKFKRENNLHYTPDQIVISCGAKHSLFNLILAVVNPGDEVIIPAPYWVSYPDQIMLAEGAPIFILTTDKSQFKITPEQLEAVITKKTKLLVLTSPSNPTGMMYTQKEFERIAEIALKHHMWIISDEIYEHLNYSHPHVSIASLAPEIKARTIVVNGVSKAYAMTGWRIGYMAAPKDIAKAVGNIQSHSTTNPTTCAQWASIEALDGPQDCIQVMKDEYLKRRKYMVETLNTIPGIRCIWPDGAFYAFPNISELYGKTTAQGEPIKDSVTFCDALLKEEKVACVPGGGFGADDYIRLSYATSMKDIEKGLRRIAQFVDKLN